MRSLDQMPWIEDLRKSWKFFLSIFSRDTCQRCQKLKLNVLWRWRFERKLCDQCWLILRRLADGDIREGKVKKGGLGDRPEGPRPGPPPGQGRR